MPWKKDAALAFIPILMTAAIFGIGYFGINGIISSNNNSHVGASSLLPLTNGSSVSSSIEGVVLEAKVNSTMLRVGQSLNITVALFNKASIASYITTTPSGTQGFNVTGFPIAMWAPCYFSEPIEFMIVKGNVSLSELEALSLNSSQPGITCMEAGSVNYLVFDPSSNVASLYGTFCAAECNPFSDSSVNLQSNFTVKGYWTYPLNTSEAQDINTPPIGGYCNTCSTFNYPEVGPTAQSLFTVGQYTVVVTDEWGQTILLHFAVV